MAALGAVFLVGLLVEQTSFAGAWIVDFDRSQERTPDGRTVNMRVLGEAFTAEQTTNTLTLVLQTEMGRKVTYRTDGVETEATGPGPYGRAMRLVYRASWSGPTLTINTQWSTDSSGGRSFLKLTLNPDGSIRAEGGPGDGDDVRMASVYKRSP